MTQFVSSLTIVGPLDQCCMLLLVRAKITTVRIFLLNLCKSGDDRTKVKTIGQKRIQSDKNETAREKWTKSNIIGQNQTQSDIIAQNQT